MNVDSTTFKSPNFNNRPKNAPISSIVLHTTEGAWDSDIEWLCNPQKSGKYDPVSCHYVISPDAKLYRIVDEEKRAWHAGSGSYMGITDWNSISIGIEVSHVQGSAWKPGQKDVLRELCLDLIRRYKIQQSRIVAHRQIAPDRRTDPTDWKQDDLVVWIASLYDIQELDWLARWGSRFWYFDESGIATAWRDAWRSGNELGEATTDEFDIKGGVCRGFQKGYITWSPANGTQVKNW